MHILKISMKMETNRYFVHFTLNALMVTVQLDLLNLLQQRPSI